MIVGADLGVTRSCGWLADWVHCMVNTQETVNSNKAAISSKIHAAPANSVDQDICGVCFGLDSSNLA